MSSFLYTGPYKTYPEFGRCIYCGETNDLTDEHIIPFALGGNAVLPKASCKKCNKITRGFEETCCRPMLGPIRIRLNLQTRRKKERPKHLPLDIAGPNGRKSIQVPAMDYPAVCIGIRLDPPSMIRGAPPSGKVTGELFGKRAQFAEAILQKGDSAVIGKFVMEPFCRMIAKIGHAHVMAAMANAGNQSKQGCQ